jgi:hypothetical protein
MLGAGTSGQLWLAAPLRQAAPATSPGIWLRQTGGGDVANCRKIWMALTGGGGRLREARMDLCFARKGQVDVISEVEEDERG